MHYLQKMICPRDAMAREESLPTVRRVPGEWSSLCPPGAMTHGQLRVLVLNNELGREWCAAVDGSGMRKRAAVQMSCRQRLPAPSPPGRPGVQSCLSTPDLVRE